MSRNALRLGLFPVTDSGLDWPDGLGRFGDVNAFQDCLVDWAAKATEVHLYLDDFGQILRDDQADRLWWLALARALDIDVHVYRTWQMLPHENRRKDPVKKHQHQRTIWVQVAGTGTDEACRVTREVGGDPLQLIETLDALEPGRHRPTRGCDRPFLFYNPTTGTTLEASHRKT